ncbi:hypothetical protein GCM10027591_09810 [Zhihengliuella somnathii]
MNRHSSSLPSARPTRWLPATGVALTALLGRIIFGEPLSPMMLLGIVMICGGVLLIEQGAAH